MDQLLKEWKMEALQHLLLEDVLHNLKCYQSLKLKVELLPALRRRKQLPWNQLYRGHLPQPITNHSPYSFFFFLNLFVHSQNHSLICTEGKSLCEALLSSNPCISFTHESISSISSFIYIHEFMDSKTFCHSRQ